MLHVNILESSLYCLIQSKLTLWQEAIIIAPIALARLLSFQLSAIAILCRVLSQRIDNPVFSNALLGAGSSRLDPGTR